MTRNIETTCEIDGIEFKAIGNRIQQALELRGMRQSELSEKTGIAKSSISEYIAGKNDPKHSKLYKIADALHVNVGWLLGGEESMEPIETGFGLSHGEIEMVKKFRTLDNHGRHTVSILLDAEYSRVQQIIAVSKGEEIGEAQTIAIPILRDALSKKVIGTVPFVSKETEENLFALKVTRDSMAPRIAPGDTVIVRKQNDVESGDIAVVLLDGVQVVCKQIIKDGETLRLVPFNSKYKERIFTTEDVKKKRFEVLGRVVENYQAM